MLKLSKIRHWYVVRAKQRIWALWLKIRGGSFKWEMGDWEKRMLQDAVKKNFNPCVNLVNSFAKGGQYEIKLTYEDDDKKQVTKPCLLEIDKVREGVPAFKIISGERLTLKSVKYKGSYGLKGEINFNDGAKKFTFDADAIQEFRSNFPSLPVVLRGKMPHLRSDQPEPELAYRRLIIQVEDTDMIYPSDILEFGENHMTFDNPAWDRQSSLMGLPFVSTKGMFTVVAVGEMNFHFYALEPMNCFVIDSLQVMAKQSFFKLTDAIRLGFAFLAGKYYRDDTIYFSSASSDFSTVSNFEFVHEGRSLLSENQLLRHDAFFERFRDMPAEQQEELEEYHTMFPADVFSKLVSEIYESVEFKRVIELVVNSSTTDDSVQKGAMCAVALETITEYVKESKGESLKPIKDNAQATAFRDSLLGELDKIRNSLSGEEATILEKKIDNINSPTNRDKLIKPFALAGITLNADDINALDQRNKYLHGDEPEDTSLDVPLHLHSLIAKLALKQVGYSGHFVNLHIWRLLHESSALIKRFNVNEAHPLFLKIQQGDFSGIDDIEQAKRLIEDYTQFLQLALKLDKLIEII